MTGTLKTTCAQCGWPLSEKSPDCERHAPMPKATKAEGEKILPRASERARGQGHPSGNTVKP